MPADRDNFALPAHRRWAVAWNLVFSYGSLAIVLLRNIALVPLYLRFIDHDEYGGWLASGGILAALTQMDFGLLSVVTQQAALAYGNRDRARLARVTGTGLACAAALCLVLFVVIGALAPLVPLTLGLHGNRAERVAWCFLIVAGANSVQLLGFMAGGVLRSLQRPTAPGSMRILSESAALAATWWLIRHDFGLWSIALGLVVRSAIELLGNATLFFWVLGRKLQMRLDADRSYVRELMSLSGLQFLTQLARALKQNIDPYLVGIFLGPPAALVYSLTSRAAETVRLLIFQIPGSVLPSLGHLYGEGDLPRFRQVILAMFRLQSAAAAIACAGVVAFNQPFMRLWLAGSEQAKGMSPDDLYGGHLLSGLIGLWSFGTLVAGISYDALFTMGDFSRLSRLNWLEQLVRLPLMVPFLLAGRMWGVPATSLLAQTATLNWMQNRRLAEKLGFGQRDGWEIAAIHLRHAVAPLALAVGVMLWGPVIRSWFELGWEAVLFCGVCGGASLLLDRPLAQVLLRRGRIG